MTVLPEVRRKCCQSGYTGGGPCLRNLPFLQTMAYVVRHCVMVHSHKRWGYRFVCADLQKHIATQLSLAKITEACSVFLLRLHHHVCFHGQWLRPGVRSQGKQRHISGTVFHMLLQVHFRVSAGISIAPPLPVATLQLQLGGKCTLRACVMTSSGKEAKTASPSRVDHIQQHDLVYSIVVANVGRLSIFIFSC